MLSFLALCLLSRFAYAFNDVLVGRLARLHSHVEIAALRGLALGLTMAPLLLFVPAPAWGALAARWPSYLLMIAATAACNVLQNHAARFLPFGLRSALMISTISIASLLLGATLFGERLSPTQAVLCLLLIGAAVLAALGDHAAHEIRPNIPKGAALAISAGLFLSVAAVLTKRLAMATHPMLTAWAWEFGAGAILVAPLLWHWRRGVPPGLLGRFRRTALASAPTVVGSGASIAALSLGALGLWGALAGTQVLFTAVLGVLWHREVTGVRRWLCFLTAAGAVSGLALFAR
jgi:drug/metabolite transporter (DMT)-like permease